MVVKFSTRFGQVVMFGDSALALLRLGGHSGAVPGAILAADLPGFLQQLQRGLERHGQEPSPAPSTPPDAASTEQEPGQERERPVSLRLRAVPLVELVETSIRRGSDLMWDRA